MRVPTLGCSCIWKILSRKSGIFLSNKNSRITSPTVIIVPLLIVNNYSEFQENIFSNNRDIRLHLDNSKSKKGPNFVQRNGGLPPLLVWVPLLIGNNYSEFQVNIFSNNRDIRKCQSFHTPPLTPGL